MDQSYGSCAKGHSNGNILYITKDQSYGNPLHVTRNQSYDMMHVQGTNPMGQVHVAIRVSSEGSVMYEGQGM